jgi:hypothetical protein
MLRQISVVLRNNLFNEKRGMPPILPRRARKSPPQPQVTEAKSAYRER